MIVCCPDCQSKYEVSSGSVPDRGIKVRCPRCKSVFPIESAIVDRAPANLVVVPGGASSDEETAASEAPTASVVESAPEPQPSRPETASVIAESHEDEEEEIEDDEHEEDVPVERTPRLVTDPTVAHRMARAIVHEIVVAKRGDHEGALQESAALRTFGPQIAEAFQQYKGRMHPDLPGTVGIFREAVNEIIGQGKSLL